MKVYKELSIEELETWSGATTTKNRIIEEGKVEEFNQLIEECYPEGIDQTLLNDILWFETEWLFESLGIEEEEY